MWGESDDEKFGPDGRYGRWLDERHASGREAEVRRMARIIQASNHGVTLEEAERRARRAINAD